MHRGCEVEDIRVVTCVNPVNGPPDSYGSACDTAGSVREARPDRVREEYLSMMDSSHVDSSGSLCNTDALLSGYPRELFACRICRTRQREVACAQK